MTYQYQISVKPVEMKYRDGVSCCKDKQTHQLNTRLSSPPVNRVAACFRITSVPP